MSTIFSTLADGGYVVPVSLVVGSIAVQYTDNVAITAPGGGETTAYVVDGSKHSGTPPPASTPSATALSVSQSSATSDTPVTSPASSPSSSDSSTATQPSAASSSGTGSIPLPAGVTASSTASADASASAATGSQQAGMQTPTPTSTPLPSKGLSGGAVAGIAIVCLVVAALLAGVITWAVMRRRVKYYRNLSAHQPGAPGGPSELDGVGEKGMNATVTSAAGGPSTAFLGGILPRSADDKEVKHRVSGMLEAAAIHADNFYQDTPASDPTSVQHEFARFDSPSLPGSMHDILLEGRSPKAAISRALAEMLTSAITPQSAASSCLLPAELAALPRARHEAGRDGNAGQSDPAMFWWRMLSAHLSPGTAENRAYVDTRAQTIAEMIQAFQAAFRPWRKPRYTDDQETDGLVSLLAHSADTGVWLLGQRAAFAFVWSRDVPAGELETRPALMKTSDADGRLLARPRLVVPRQMDRVD